jgi:hypothetical protein
MAAHNLECRNVKIVLIIIKGIHFHSSHNEISKANTVCEFGLNGRYKECTKNHFPKHPLQRMEHRFRIWPLLKENSVPSYTF